MKSCWVPLVVFLDKKRHSKRPLEFSLCPLNRFNHLFFFAGWLCRSGGPFAVFSDGSFLLDACGGNLPLLVCCQGLQHRGQNACISSDFLG